MSVPAHVPCALTLTLRPGAANRQIYNRAAYCIHAAIHAARPDVDAAAHSHSIYGKAFSTLGKTLGASLGRSGRPVT